MKMEMKCREARKLMWPGPARPDMVVALLCAFLLFCLLPAGLAQATEVQDVLRIRVEQIRRSGEFQIGEDFISAVIVLPEFYENRDFEPAWTERHKVENLLKAIRGIQADGLYPWDYHLEGIERLLAEEADGGGGESYISADLDMLLTDAILRLAYHMLFGKVDPERLDPNWNLSGEIDGLEPAAGLEKALGSTNLYTFIEEFKPDQHFYLRLKDALASYRGIADMGGWGEVPLGKVLKKSEKDERVPILKERLYLTGDLEDIGNDTSLLFGADLEEAVMRFQTRHGLSADGVVGPRTLEAMNVPVSDRIDQIRVNLERTRWVMQDITETFVIVNIAGFMTYYVDDSKIQWEGRSQVGKIYRKTPVFKADMKYLVFNPTWTVPPTILAKDVLPAVQKDVSYLERKNMSVLDRSGKAVNPQGIDWAKYDARNFPYVFRQEPGPENALGLIKFIFPNEHSVFLHDTPSKSLFNRDARTFSSGCIRVENPFELAELLLSDQPGWTREKIAAVVESGKTQTVYLTEPVPVLLLYWTAFPGEDGICNFREDVYDRDPAVLKALGDEFSLRRSHMEQR
ncbi:murein L,D-transpeptidase [Candidatus Eisenbacteria bacterium]|uniref:Murein L,D-transpeptidase n=1 Tax=Eiseniibacteriota bacterium TaxID=2212470 RepID=A0ABV6YQ32_UNCEI